MKNNREVRNRGVIIDRNTFFGAFLLFSMDKEGIGGPNFIHSRFNKIIQLNLLNQIHLQFSLIYREVLLLVPLFPS